MPLLIATFVLLLLVVGLMSLPALLGRPPLRRGCRGPFRAECEACPRPCPRRGRGGRP